jgi:hypothetical protein
LTNEDELPAIESKTQPGIDWDAMKAPFEPCEIEWRLQKKGLSNGHPWGLCLAYVTARAVMDRLDDVCGPENWQITEPVPVHTSEVIFAYDAQKWNSQDFETKLCYGIPPKKGTQNHMMQGVCTHKLAGFNIGISVRVSGEWITKWDGADVTDFEEYKGGISSAVKRAAVHFGIGRYLYGLKDNFADFKSAQAQKSIKKEYIQGSEHNWLPPMLSERFLPEGWSGDQHEHLIKGAAAKPKKKAAKRAPAKKPDLLDTPPSAGTVPASQSTRGDDVFQNAVNAITGAIEGDPAQKAGKLAAITSQVKVRRSEKKITEDQAEQLINLITSA